MKRTISTFVLAAFVVAAVAPCAAAYMSCGMKMPSADERCAACAPDRESGPVLRAGSCCSFRFGEDRAQAPAVLSASAPGTQAPAKALPAASTASSATRRDAVQPICGGPPGTALPLASPPHTTVLRL